MLFHFSLQRDLLNTMQTIRPDMLRGAVTVLSVSLAARWHTDLASTFRPVDHLDGSSTRHGIPAPQLGIRLLLS